MALYQDWEALAQQERDKAASDKFWTDYFEKETKVYQAILTANTGKLTGTIGALAEQNHMEPTEFAGFLDGINTSLTEELDLTDLSADTALDLTVDFEKLYYNMLNAKAPWLYDLDEWAGVLSEEKRQQIAKQFKEAHIYHAPVTVGRNDPCPCGSGKKYKKCCGANL